MGTSSHEPKRARVQVLLTSKARGASSFETELLWSEPLGNDLYAVTNIPFLAYNLNVGDVVRCSSHENGILVVSEIVERSGTHTLRLFFSREATDEQIDAILSLLDDIETIVEKGSREQWAVALRTDEAMANAVVRLEKVVDPRVFGFEPGYQPTEPWA